MDEEGPRGTPNCGFLAVGGCLSSMLGTSVCPMMCAKSPSLALLLLLLLECGS